MAVQVLGTRLVRTFGSGERLRHVVSETVNGKTYTKVLDNAGKVIRDRVKSFSQASVGDKFVKTRTTVISSYGDLKKEIYDRVYSSDSKELLGMRETVCDLHPDGTIYDFIVDKQARNTGRYRKYFDSNGRVYTKGHITFWDNNSCKNQEFSLGSQSISLGGPVGRINYTKRGLPLSVEVAALDTDLCNNKSLKELTALHREIAPHKPYSEGVNLGFLDNNISQSHNLSNLDLFL